EEAKLPAHVLCEQPAAVGGTTDVHDLRARKEPDAPTGLPEAVAPVGLLAEHEEVLIEEADLVGGVPPHQQAGPEEPVHPPGFVVDEVTLVEPVQHARARGPVWQE